MMQVNMFLDLEQRNLQQQEQNHLNLTLCCKNVYLPDINEVVGGWWMWHPDQPIGVGRKEFSDVGMFV